MSSNSRASLLLTALAGVLLGACASRDPYQGLTQEELFAIAEQEFREEDYDRAIRALERFLVSFGDVERTPEARLMLAKSYFERGEFLTARSEYQRYIERYGTGPQAAEAALGSCYASAELAPNAHRDPNYTRDAATICANVATDFAGTEEARVASEIATRMRATLAEKEYLNADFYFRRKLYDSAIKYYEFVLELYPDTEFAPLALQGLYLANQAIGYDDEAEEAKDRLLASYPDSEPAARVRGDAQGS